MNMKLLVAAFVATIPCSAFAATTLPDACGNAAVKFDVKTEKNATAPSSPDSSNARVVFLEALNKPGSVLVKPTVRFGLDGVWVGAVKGNSYFTVSLPSGEHHVCAAWQSKFNTYRKNVGLAALNVEPGKTYYVRYKVDLIATENGAAAITDLAPINEDEARFLLKTSELATSTASQ
jgi:hypothetical protein